MGHYARVTDGIVTSVIVAEADFFDTFIDDTAGEWIKTSYNTYGGVHSSGGTPLRKNYASVGYHYDSEADAFYAPQPYPSWTLNKSTYIWEPDTPYPDDNSVAYEWDDSSLSWVQVVL